MPQVTITTTTKKPSNEAQKATTTQKTTTVTEKSSRNRRRNRQRRQRKRSKALRAGLGLEKALFKAFLLAPDLVGPQRIPRPGGATRTGLAHDETTFKLTGDGSNTVYGAQVRSVYSDASGAALKYTVATDTTSLGAGTGTTIQAQFPTAGQMADVNCTAIDLTVYYIGNPLTVAGEVILGTSLPFATGASYAGMFYYPGTISFPTAHLIEHPMRVSARKLSPLADEFVTTSAGNGDFDLPFVLIRDIPNGASVVVKVYRTFEYRSTTTSGSVITYEKVGESHSSDLAAMQDAQADIAMQPNTVSDFLPEMGNSVSAAWAESLGLTPSFLMGGVSSLVGAAGFLAHRARAITGRQSAVNSPEIQIGLARFGRAWPDEL